MHASFIGSRPTSPGQPTLTTISGMSVSKIYPRTGSPHHEGADREMGPRRVQHDRTGLTHVAEVPESRSFVLAAPFIWSHLVDSLAKPQRLFGYMLVHGICTRTVCRLSLIVIERQ